MKNLLGIFLFEIILSGCAFFLEDRNTHQVFIDQNSWWVGKNVNVLHQQKYFPPLDAKILKNSNIEEKWGWHVSWNKKEQIYTCFVFYEHDPKTKVVVNWRYEGRKEDCIGVP
jgi:hypothetical protein